MSLKNFSPCYDKISPVVANQVVKYICKPLCHIFNLSLKHGIIPLQMKTKLVVSIFRNDDKELITNYNPAQFFLAFLRYWKKLFERSYKYLLKHNILCRYQFGFVPGPLTTHALLYLTDMIINDFHMRHFSGTFLDLPRAFYTLHHCILFSKLENYEVRDNF